MLTFDPLLFYGAPLAAICTLVGFNFHRARKFSSFSLHPNCLITRFPLVFVSGTQSPFYFLRFWNQVPWYLREHGYVVEEWNLPWRDDEQRRKRLIERIESATHPLHLFFDGSEHSSRRDLAARYPAKIASITFVEEDTDACSLSADKLRIPLSATRFTFAGALSKLSLFAHQIWSGNRMAAGGQGLGLPGQIEEVHYRKFLHHAVRLAEGDMER